MSGSRFRSCRLSVTCHSSTSSIQSWFAFVLFELVILRSVWTILRYHIPASLHRHLLWKCGPSTVKLTGRHTEMIPTTTGGSLYIHARKTADVQTVWTFEMIPTNATIYLKRMSVMKTEGDLNKTYRGNTRKWSWQRLSSSKSDKSTIHRRVLPLFFVPNHPLFQLFQSSSLH
jgi:hypothetical protein